MTTHLVTFSDESMSRAAVQCIKSATANGVDHARWWQWWLFRQESVYRDDIELFSQPRGLGHWAWKPWVILTTMNEKRMKDGDILIYADAGIEFIAPVSHVVERMNQDVWLFGNNWEHAHWCKRDVIANVWPMSGHEWRRRWWAKSQEQRQAENPDLVHWERYSKQVQASVIFFRVSDYMRQFVAEWLKWCLFEGGRLIDDSPSRLPNHPEFREHRHDQAILTTMAYREGIKLHYWPAVYNRGGSPEFVYEKLPEYAGDDYPVLFAHHRKRNHEWGNTA